MTLEYKEHQYFDDTSTVAAALKAADVEIKVEGTKVKLMWRFTHADQRYYSMAAHVESTIYPKLTRILYFAEESAEAVCGVPTEISVQEERFTEPTDVGVTLGVTYSNSDEEIATVDADGKVTGKKAGEVTITATATETPAAAATEGEPSGDTTASGYRI